MKCLSVLFILFHLCAVPFLCTADSSNKTAGTQSRPRSFFALLNSFAVRRFSRIGMGTLGSMMGLIEDWIGATQYQRGLIGFNSTAIIPRHSAVAKSEVSTGSRFLALVSNFFFYFFLMWNSFITNCTANNFFIQLTSGFGLTDSI